MDIFDPAHYRVVRRQVGEAETLPAWAYTSQEFYAREVERIFTPGWHFVARVDEVPEPGSYLAVDTVRGPLLLLRDANHRVSAFPTPAGTEGRGSSTAPAAAARSSAPTTPGPTVWTAACWERQACRTVRTSTGPTGD
jgi:hypothetical protein